MKRNENITWFTVNNIVPLVGSAIMIAASFFALSNKVDLLSQKLDGIVENTKAIALDVKDGSEKVNNHEVRITLLEDRKQTKTSSASLVSKLPPPTPTENRTSQVTVNQSFQGGSEEISSTPQSSTPSSTPTPTAEPSPSVIQIINDLLEGL